MIFDKPIYTVFLDGDFIGITDDEMECWEIAEQHTYGTPNILHHDDVDKVWWNTIDINRFNGSSYCIYDKLQEIDNFLCYNRYEAEKCCKEMNKLNLQKERLEAKERAMTL